MPLNYLEGGPQNAYALQRLGSTFSDAILGLQAQRVAQQRFFAQQALEQQRIAIEQGRAKEEASTMGLQRQLLQQKYNEGQAQTEAGQGLQEDIGRYGAEMGKPEEDTAALNTILTAIARRQATIAATSPSNIGTQVPNIMESMNPMVRRMMATGQRPVMDLSPGASAYDLINKRVLATNPVSSSMSPELLKSDVIRNFASALGAAGGQYGDKNPEVVWLLNELLKQSAAKMATTNAPLPGLPTPSSDKVTDQPEDSRPIGNVIPSFRSRGGITASVPTVITKAQFDALPSGATYIGADGTRYKKP